MDLSKLKNNFIGKDRNITYLNNLQLSESVSTLLLTTKTKLITLELKHVSTIVILNKSMDLGQFLDIGFTVDFHDNTIHVLKK